MMLQIAYSNQMIPTSLTNNIYPSEYRIVQEANDRQIAYVSRNPVTPAQLNMAGHLMYIICQGFII